MRKIFILIFALLLLNARFSLASCGSSDCPLHFYNRISSGLFYIGLTYENIYQNQIYIGSDRSFVGAISQHHDEVSTLNQITSFQAGYGLFDFLKLKLNVPFVHREHTHIHHHHGEELLESWNFSGIGDMIVTANFLLLNNNNLSFSLDAGIKFPTGVADLKNEAGELAEVTIQPGTGATDFIVGATYAVNLFTVKSLWGSKFSAVPIVFNVSYRINNKGTDDYRLGNSMRVHLGTAFRLVEKVSALIQINAKFQEYADPGLTNEPYKNTGGKWVFVSPGIKFHFDDSFSAYSYLQLPVYRNFNGIQQGAPYNLQFNIQKELTF